MTKPATRPSTQSVVAGPSKMQLELRELKVWYMWVGLQYKGVDITVNRAELAKSS